MANYPVIVSITTLPSRIAKIRPCLESLLSGSVVPHKILLPLPKISAREQSAYVLPDFLKSEGFCGQIVEVVSVERDWGPGTKLLGALNFVQQPCYLITADDDVRYKHRFLEGIVTAQKSNHSASFSYYTYKMDGLTVGQGCDGFSFWSPNIFGIKSFAERHVLGKDLYYHDDFWISFFLAAKGISIKSLGNTIDIGTIYEDEYVDKNSLRFLDGRLARDKLHREGVKRLLKEVDMPVRRRIRMRSDTIFARLLMQPLQRIVRKLRRVIYKN